MKSILLRNKDRIMTPEMLAGLWVAAAYILSLSIKELAEKAEPSILYCACSIFFFAVIAFGSTGIYVPAQDKIVSSNASAYGGIVFFIFSFLLTFLTWMRVATGNFENRSKDKKGAII